MTRNEAFSLKPGHVVQWDDPDNGLCSHVFTIKCIEFCGAFFRIIDTNGIELECYSDELSWA